MNLLYNIYNPCIVYLKPRPLGIRKRCCSYIITTLVYLNASNTVKSLGSGLYKTWLEFLIANLQCLCISLRICFIFPFEIRNGTLETLS